MNKEDANDLINNLLSLSKGIIDLGTFKEILLPNYMDMDGNGYFHFLTEYSFKEFCLRNMKLNKNEKFISLEKYNEIKKEYTQQINSFTKILLELNCDLFLVNGKNQSPLYFSINNNNYIISIEYLKILQNVGLYTNEDYYDFLETIIKKGNIFDKDCIELINLILLNIATNNNMNNNIDYPKNKLTTLIISLCKNYSENIYEKYNEIIKLESMEYIDKYDENNIIMKDENTIQNIKKKAFDIFNDYINNNFLPLFNSLINLGAELQYKKESGFIYLMSYPFFLDIQNFVQQNKIDINFQDELGNTPLMNLINNKENIIQISKDIYDNTKKYFFDSINLDLSIENKKGLSTFNLYLMKDDFEEAKFIYSKYKNILLSDFNSDILNYIIQKNNAEKIIEFLNEFKDEIDYNLFNIEQKRSLIHYICLYLSDDSHINIFTQLINFIDNLKVDYLLKDQFERNFLFYLFLDQNDNNKINDPIQQLKCIFQKFKFNDLNERDIFGNTLIFYIIQSKAEKCLEFLLDNGIVLPSEQDSNENSIFEICLLNKNFQLFYSLYGKVKDTKIFDHKIYEDYKINNFNGGKIGLDKSKKGETLYDFLNKNNIEKNQNNINNNVNMLNNNYSNNNIFFNNSNNPFLNNNNNNNKQLFKIIKNPIPNNNNNNIFFNNSNNPFLNNNNNNNSIFDNNYNKIINPNPNNNNLFNNNFINPIPNNNNLFNNNLINPIANNNQYNNNNLFNNPIPPIPKNNKDENFDLFGGGDFKDEEKIINKISDKNDFNYFNFLSDDLLKKLNEFVNNITIKINIDINNIKENIKKPNEKSILDSFLKNNEDYIFERINCKRDIISENLFRYCLSNNYEDTCKFIINNNYNLISVCNDLIFFHRYNDIIECLLKILTESNYDESKLRNLVDKKGQTVYHLLPLIQNNSKFCKQLKNHNISNLYDVEGITPMYNACKNFDINFIQTFSHYSFDSHENFPNYVNYNLFLETKNNKTPLEALYDQINKKENRILKIIIDISINTKRVIFIPVVKYLIQNYSPNNNALFKLDYKANLNSNEYLKKVIGLYQFYTNELKGNIMVKDESGNDPFIICAQNNNYDFIFNVLLEEHYISLDSTNNEGKTIIHFILELSGYLNKYKRSILIKAIESGFDFNIKDNDGLLPIDYAFIEEDNESADVLLDYYTNFGIEFSINKDIKPKKKLNKLNYDYNKDSDIFYNESISVSMNIDKNENLNGLVNEMFKYDPLISFYQVCVDGENIPFNANLVKNDNLINLFNPNNLNNYNNNILYNNRNNFGLNRGNNIFNQINQSNGKKYCLQIIKDVNKDNEYLTIAIDNSNLKTFTFKDFISAQNKFKEIFKEITNNEWDNVKNNRLNFKTDYTKYYIFDYTYEEENAIYDYLKITIKNLYIQKKSEYKGNIKIKKLMYYLLVKSYQNKFSIDENTINVEQNTKSIIERYKSTAIAKATSILLELKKLLNYNNNDEKYNRKRNYLINSYNDLIPYSKKNKDLNLFNDPLNIDYEISRLTNYYYIENVLKIFLGAIYNLNNIHPLDYIINALGCQIEELPKPQNNNQLITEADYIYNFVNSTGGMNTSISAIYKITQSVNDKNFNLNNYDNRYIFFHGTKVENVIGILSQGLKISPVQAAFTGSSYGRGIYLSDSFSVSLGYCGYAFGGVPSIFGRVNPRINKKKRFNNNNMINNNLNNVNNNIIINDDYDYSNKLFMFMAEVAVGKTGNQVGNNADTFISNMSMDFNDYFVTNEGYRIFKNSRKNMNGAVIVAHEETNVRIKYLIEIG